MTGWSTQRLDRSPEHRLDVVHQGSRAVGTGRWSTGVSASGVPPGSSLPPQPARAASSASATSDPRPPHAPTVPRARLTAAPTSDRRRVTLFERNDQGPSRARLGNAGQTTLRKGRQPLPSVGVREGLLPVERLGVERGVLIHVAQVAHRRLDHLEGTSAARHQPLGDAERLVREAIGLAPHG